MDVHIHKLTSVLCSMIGNTTQVSLVLINVGREIQLTNRQMFKVKKCQDYLKVARSLAKSLTIAVKELIFKKKKLENFYESQ
jgi:hypothetical protein